MKIYRKIMNIVAVIEDVVLVLSFVLILALTFGNVVARKIFQHSWGFTEEIVIAVFVLLSLLAAGVAARRPGGLTSLSLVPDLVGPRGKKVLNVLSNLACVIYSLILAYQGWGRMKVDQTLSPILHIPKVIFWSFVLIGGISLALHFVENGIVYCSQDLKKEENNE
ncbi:MAG: TRAP transporter small permease subunit [Clostridiales bacterium]|nr:TRAP transporter small permease subunit [Clostridiales bacterium]